jgi:hypothetical protein
MPSNALCHKRATNVYAVYATNALSVHAINYTYHCTSK